MFGDGNEVKSDYICVYAGGELVGGTEPNGSTPKPAETTVTTTTTATTTTTTTTVTDATTTESEPATTASATEVTTTESEPVTTTSETEVTTTESEPVTTTSLTEATTTTTEADADIYYGDVNQDGVVDLVDAIFINKALANMITLSDSAAKCADCYDDGIFDDKDATILMRFVIGKINNLPWKEL